MDRMPMMMMMMMVVVHAVEQALPSDYFDPQKVHQLSNAAERLLPMMEWVMMDGLAKPKTHLCSLKF
jgi:hypothetical protein